MDTVTATAILWVYMCDWLEKTSNFKKLSKLGTVVAKIKFPFPFLSLQEKRSGMDRAVGVPCLLYARKIFSNRLFGVETT